MRRLKRSVIVAAVVAVLALFMVQAAQAGWFWNAQLDVEGAEVHLAWSVDDEDGQDDYRALIAVRYPKGADVTVVSQMTENEKVVLIPSRQLEQTEAGVEIEATFLITPRRGADGRDVHVSIVGPTGTLDEGDGTVRRKIALSAVVPTGDGDDDDDDDDGDHDDDD